MNSAFTLCGGVEVVSPEWPDATRELRRAHWRERTAAACVHRSPSPVRQRSLSIRDELVLQWRAYWLKLHLLPPVARMRQWVRQTRGMHTPHARNFKIGIRVIDLLKDKLECCAGAGAVSVFPPPSSRIRWLCWGAHCSTGRTRATRHTSKCVMGAEGAELRSERFGIC